MKLTWKKKSGYKKSLPFISSIPNLPFDDQTTPEQKRSSNYSPQEADNGNDGSAQNLNESDHDNKLAHTFLRQGNQLAEAGKYSEALGKWEAAITLMPEKAVLHEQKAQVLLEIGDVWNAIRAATRATELEPTWAEAWITLGRAQLNFGEPDLSLESFDKALVIKPDLEEVQADRDSALHLIKRRKQHHSSSSTCAIGNRFVVGEKPELS